MWMVWMLLSGACPSQGLCNVPLDNPRPMLCQQGGDTIIVPLLNPVSYLDKDLPLTLLQGALKCLTEEPRSPCGSQVLQASGHPSQAATCSREPPGQPLQLRPLRGSGPGAAGTDAAALGSQWDMGAALRWDVAGLVERTGGAAEARPPALLWLGQLLQEPPSLQEAAPSRILRPWESLQPFKDFILSEILHPSGIIRPSEIHHPSGSFHSL